MIGKKLPSLFKGYCVGALLIAAVFVSGCSDSGSGPYSNAIRLLWVNDTHGYFMPVYHAEFEELDTYAATAATEGKVGGYAQIKKLADTLKAEKLNALFLDAGDTFDGSPVAQMTRGEAVIPVLNAMGYDAMTPGNRDFAFGKADFLKVTSMIDFPILSMNLRDADTGQLVFPPYIIKKLPKLTVAIIGLSHPFSTNGFVHGEKLAPRSSYAAFEVADELTALVTKIRASDSPDLVVVISHFGYLQDRKLASLQSGVDVILGAHTHHNIFEIDPVKDTNGNDVIVVQAGSHGKFLGQLDLMVTEKRVSSHEYKLIRMITKNYEADPTVLALANEAYAPLADYLDRVIGTTTTVIARRGEVQSTMADLLTDAWSAIFGTDLSRHFGIRYGSSIIPGPITVGDVWNMISPNIGGNSMYVGTVLGSYVRGQVNGGLNREYGPDPYDWAGGDTTRFNKNVTYTYNVKVDKDSHIVDLKIGDDYLVQNGVNNSANLAKTYTYAGSAPAGSATPRLAGTTAVEEIVAYIEAQKTFSPTIDGRTKRLD